MGAVVSSGLPRPFVWIEFVLGLGPPSLEVSSLISSFDFLLISVTQVTFLTKLKKQRSQFYGALSIDLQQPSESNLADHPATAFRPHPRDAEVHEAFHVHHDKPGIDLDAV
jgi:hypothetical protein